MNPASLLQQVNELSLSISTLTQQIEELSGMKSGQLPALKQAVATARDALNSAQTAMIGQYADAVVTAVNTYLDYEYGSNSENASADDIGAEEKAKLEREAGGRPISEVRVAVVGGVLLRLHVCV